MHACMLLSLQSMSVCEKECVSVSYFNWMCKSQQLVSLDQSGVCERVCVCVVSGGFLKKLRQMQGTFHLLQTRFHLDSMSEGCAHLLTVYFIAQCVCLLSDYQ